MRLKVIAHTNSRLPRVEKDLFNDLHVYVNEPPQDGKANEAIIKALAKHFGISKSLVQIISGHTSKHKLFKIN